MTARTILEPSPYAGWVSPGDLRVEIECVVDTLWKHEGRELLRGFCGALFVALPLLYTMEMWERARGIPEWTLCLLFVLTYVLNVGYLSFSGFKAARSRNHILLDSITAMGLGVVASVITLVITARMTPDTPPAVMASLVGLMMMPTSIGASIAINQLGKRQYGTSEGQEDLAEVVLNEDAKKLVATTLGATLFAYNIFPTIEPKVMLGQLAGWHAIAIAAFSLLISYIISFTARFNNADDDRETDGVLDSPLLATAATYIISLVVSAVLLWAFGYIGLSTPPEMWVPWVVLVGYAATLGGAAGRIVL